MHDWMERAACRGMDPEMFFPTGSLSPHVRAACGSCTVQAECLEFIMDVEAGTPDCHRFGVYAGLSASKRGELARSSR